MQFNTNQATQEHIWIDVFLPLLKSLINYSVLINTQVS